MSLQGANTTVVGALPVSVSALAFFAKMRLKIPLGRVIGRGNQKGREVVRAGYLAVVDGIGDAVVRGGADRDLFVEAAVEAQRVQEGVVDRRRLRHAVGRENVCREDQRMQVEHGVRQPASPHLQGVVVGVTARDVAVAIPDLAGANVLVAAEGEIDRLRLVLGVLVVQRKVRKRDQRRLTKFVLGVVLLVNGDIDQASEGEAVARIFRGVPDQLRIVGDEARHDHSVDVPAQVIVRPFDFVRVQPALVGRLDAQTERVKPGRHGVALGLVHVTGEEPIAVAQLSEVAADGEPGLVNLCGACACAQGHAGKLP